MGERRIDATAVRWAMMVADRLPPPILQPILDLALAQVRRRHPEVFDSLAAYGPAVFAADASDLPLVLCFRLGEQPRLMLRRRPVNTAAAMVRGTFDTLLDLLEGEVDGDTLFFSRRLDVEGRADLVVAIRNAMDGRGLNFGQEVSGALGPVGPLALQVRTLLATVLTIVEGTAGRPAPRSSPLPAPMPMTAPIDGGRPWN